MKKSILIVVSLIFGISTAVCCADLIIGQKRYEFKYEVVKSPKKPTYVVKHKPYRNPLVVGFSINNDGTIEALDPADKKRLANQKEMESPAPSPRLGADAVPSEEHRAEMDHAKQEVLPTHEKAQYEKVVKSKIFTVYFKRGSSRLGTETVRSLNALPIDISRSEFEVRGYTCPLGSMKINSKLANERARMVSKILQSLGGKIVNEIGKPMCCYASQDDYTKNRRAEIYLVTREEKGGRGIK